MQMTTLVQLVDRLAEGRILVVGDLILDHYVFGSSERISPEAPVPVVLHEREESIPGGAANVARGVVAAGGRAVCIGVTGSDSDGRLLCERLANIGVDCDRVLALPGRPTTTKTRIVSHGQQMLRLDRESTAPLPSEAERALGDACCEAMPGCGAVILSDYAKGVLTEGLVRRIVSRADELGIPALVDPKGRDFARYRGVHALTPNAREAGEATGIATRDDGGIAQAAAAIRGMTGCRLVAITRGSEGVTLFDADAPPLHIRASAREVFDVTGAGDTFIAILAMAVAAGIAPGDAARLANAAGGAVVGKSGAATVSPAELRAALTSDLPSRKLCPAADLGALGERLRAAGKRVVFTNGCFDFLHAGHVAFFQRARALGDVLVVATNTDGVIARLKGAPRPIVREDQRLSLLAAFESIDHIVPFADDTPHALIGALRPDVLVKGSNYSLAQVEGHEIVQAYGGRVELLDLVEGISTGDLLRCRSG
jgi:D-beta-D-heptose 7-phosphate kinase/D-beta-D-heptose 1-phosphate adenosyltransferase